MGETDNGYMKYLGFIFLLIFISCEHVKEQAAAENDQPTEGLVTQNTEVCGSLENVADELRAPKTINETTDLINALPKPLTLPCFLKSLKRPFFINLTPSTLSAQPADGEESPRIFLFFDNLILSVVPSGRGAPYLELSELIGDTNSIKAELEFPIENTIEYRKAFDNINTGGMTSCSGCHFSEVRDNRFTDYEVYRSKAVKPNRNILLEDFVPEFYACELQRVPDDRCRMIIAIFEQGQVSPKDFPTAMPTWFNSF